MFSYLAGRLALLCQFSLILAASLSKMLTPGLPLPLPLKKSFITKNGPKYAYYYIEAKKGKPTFLLLHGFPSTANEWHNQISDLNNTGYGVICPDMLGYGDTDKPTEVEAYSMPKMAGEIAQILDHEKLTQVVGVGHDWGAGFLGRFWNYQPKYLSALAFLSVPYSPPVPFDLDGINAQTKAAFGYEVFGYMYTLNETDAADLLSTHALSFLSLVYPNDPAIHKTELCPRGKAKEWMLADRVTPLPSYETSTTREARLAQFKKGGWTAPTNWYKSNIRDIDHDANAALPPSTYTITKPVTFVGGDKDLVTRPELMQQVAAQGKEQGWLPNVTFKLVTGGSHWMILEESKQIFEILDGIGKTC